MHVCHGWTESRQRFPKTTGQRKPYPRSHFETDALAQKTALFSTENRIKLANLTETLSQLPRKHIQPDAAMFRAVHREKLSTEESCLDHSRKVAEKCLEEQESAQHSGKCFEE